jgi:Domain of unknown function (DUF4350)
VSPMGRGATRARVVGGLLLALVVVAAFALGAPDRDEPLDPRSDARLGTSALVALADELAGEVEIADRLPAPGTPGATGPDVVLLLRDRLDDAQRYQLAAWVRDGGTLVVVDPGSPLTPALGATFSDLDEVRSPGSGPVVCDVPALAGLDLAAVDPRGGGALYEVPAGADGCLVAPGGDAYIVATDEGAGTLVAVGGSGMFVNAGLAEGENAPVVAALVAPTPGTDVAVLEPGLLAAGAGARSLVDLISPGVKRALLQLGIAFAVYALWRARRLGRPVEEPQPVAVAGSELVAAVGSLLDRSGSQQHAADLLRAELRRELGDRLGLPPGTPPAVLASVAAARTGSDEARMRWALGVDAGPVADEAGLVALTHTIDAVRQEVLSHA